MNLLDIRNQIVGREQSNLDWMKESDIQKNNRLFIYQNAYFSRLENTLKNDYPLLNILMEKLELMQVWLDYIKLYPSNYYNIAEVGFHLPHYFKKHFLISYKDDFKAIQYQQLLLEFSVFETATNKMFFNKNAHIINFEIFKKLGIFKKFKLQKNLIFKNFNYPIAKIASSLNSNAFKLDANPCKTSLIIWRDGDFNVQWETVSQREKKLLRFFKTAKSFNQFIQTHSEYKIEELSLLMKKWLDLQLLAQ